MMLWGSFSNCATSGGGGVHVLVPPTIHTLPSGCFLMLLKKAEKPSNIYLEHRW